MEWAFGNFNSDWWWSRIITSIFFSFAKSIGSNERVPQSTVKIRFTSKLINSKKAFLFGPKPSLNQYLKI